MLNASMTARPVTKRTAPPLPVITGKCWDVLEGMVLLPEDAGDHREVDEGVGEDADVVLLRLSLAGAVPTGGVAG